MEITVKVLTELKELNSRSHFKEDTKSRELLDVLKIMNDDSGEIALSLMKKIVDQSIQYSNRNKYVALKWMIFLHEVLQVTTTLFVVDHVICILENMKWPQAKSKFQRYMISKLMRPYHQYLNKKAEILTQTLEEDSPEDLQSNQENEKQNIGYCEYNLMNYGCKELSKPVQQFYGFFQKYYPCLNGYICLLNRDIRRSSKRLRSWFNKGKLSKLTYIELQNLNMGTTLFSRIAEDKRLHSWIMTETQTRSEHFYEQGSEQWCESLIEFQ